MVTLVVRTVFISIFLASSSRQQVRLGLCLEHLCYPKSPPCVGSSCLSLSCFPDFSEQSDKGPLGSCLGTADEIGVPTLCWSTHTWGGRGGADPHLGPPTGTLCKAQIFWFWLSTFQWKKFLLSFGVFQTMLCFAYLPFISSTQQGPEKMRCVCTLEILKSVLRPTFSGRQGWL